MVVAALKSAGAAPEAAPLGSTSDGDSGGDGGATFSPMVRVAVYGSDGAPLVVAEMRFVFGMGGDLVKSCGGIL